MDLNIGEFMQWRTTLTPKRVELLIEIYQQGAISIRALSRVLNRDYKNVHVDIRILEDAGLLQRSETGALHVPCETITLYLSLGKRNSEISTMDTAHGH